MTSRSLREIFNLTQMNYNSVLSRLYEYNVFTDSTPMQIKIHIKDLENEQNLKSVFQLYVTFLSP